MATLKERVELLEELDKEAQRITNILTDKPEGLTEDAEKKYRLRLREIEEERTQNYPNSKKEMEEMNKLAGEML